ncbi:hypothetical protein ACIQCJ_32365 [Streptomyces sp. NPDC093221]|uniref:hypothetical protein n=1 Tax=Streptomyces sp. NPDC093221 TaxID=3366032 RepID=UPI00380D8869
MRRLPVVVFLVAASAAAGCTTVSAPPAPVPVPAPVPGRAAPRVAAPDGGPLVPRPDHVLLETAEPDPAPSRTPSPEPERGAGESGGRPGAAPYSAGQGPRPGPEPRHRPVPRSRSVPPPRSLPRGPAAALPGAADVCALGETYGGWAKDGDAARICRQSYGR